MADTLDDIEIGLRSAEPDLARLEAARLHEQLSIVREVLADERGTAEEKLAYLRDRLGA